MEILKSSLDYTPNNLEREINTLEIGMGIETAADRFLEACLFIDQKFVIGALLTDSPLPIERMFGDKEWASYLQARLLTRHVPEDEDIALLLEGLHICIMGEAGNEQGGDLRGFDGGLGGMFIDGEFCPIDITEEQLRNLKQLGRGIGFLSAGDPDHPYRGYVDYAGLTTDEIYDELFGGFGAYIPNKNPYIEAAGAQQTVSVVHPYNDVSGRLSRFVMNWRLECRGRSPSILSDFDADVFSTPEEWQAEVEAGSKKYEEMQRLIEAGVTEPIDLMGLGQLKRFHDDLYQPSEGVTKPVYEPGAIHPHLITQLYLADVEKQASRYFASMG